MTTPHTHGGTEHRALLRRKVGLYMHGLRPSLQDSLAYELNAVMDSACREAFEDGRRQVLDELAEIVSLLEKAASP